jgi:hypothetical protein
MKLLSYTCKICDEEQTESWLKELGVTVFRKIEIDEHIPGLGYQTASYKFIFNVPDIDTEVFIKLKYKTGTFEDHSA